MSAERHTITAQKMTIEPLEEGIRVHLQIVYTSPQHEEAVALSVDLKSMDQTLPEIQREATERARLILELFDVSSRQSPAQPGTPDEALAVWEKLSR